MKLHRTTGEISPATRISRGRCPQLRQLAQCGYQEEGNEEIERQMLEQLVEAASSREVEKALIQKL